MGATCSNKYGILVNYATAAEFRRDYARGIIPPAALVDVDGAQIAAADYYRQTAGTTAPAAPIDAGKNAVQTPAPALPDRAPARGSVEAARVETPAGRSEEEVERLAIEAANKWTEARGYKDGARQMRATMKRLGSMAWQWGALCLCVVVANGFMRLDAYHETYDTFTLFRFENRAMKYVAIVAGVIAVVSYMLYHHTKEELSTFRRILYRERERQRNGAINERREDHGRHERDQKQI